MMVNPKITLFNRSFMIIVAAVITISSAMLPSVAYAEPVTGFNPGRIIDDGVFSDFGTMSPGNIQFFFNVKGVFCSNGEAPCLKNFSEGGKSAAQIVYDASQEFQINPQVLIATLQKEVGLVTANQPGSWRYRTAMGYGCPDSTPGVCDGQYYGFTNQMRWAARMFHAIMIDSPTWYTPYEVGNNFIQWSPNGGCGGTNVYIQNRATQALYNYTPYQPNQAALNAGYGTGDGCSAYGNRNFFLYFRDWFGNSQQSPIVRSPSSPTYYLVTNNKKYAISNGDILYAYGLESAPLSVVSDAYLSTITDGGLLNTIFTIPGDGTVFLADGGKKYGIASGAYCTSWGLSCGNPAVEKVIGPEIAGLLASGGTLQNLSKFGGTYYLMQNGKKQQFLSQKSVQERGYSPSSAIPIVNWTNAIRPFDISLPENNSFVKFAAGSGIYLYSGGQFFTIPDYETYTNWLGPSGASFFDDSSAYNVSPPPVASAISNLVSNGGTVSVVGFDKKFNLSNTSPSVTPFNITSYPQLINMLSGKQAVTIDSTKALALPGGTIAALKNNTIQPIPTMTDLYMSFSPTNIISTPTMITKAYPIGKLYMIPGRIFQPTGIPAMYVYGADGELWALGSLAELHAVQQWNPNIVISGINDVDHTTIKVFSGLAKINNVNYVVLPDGRLKTLPGGVIANTSKIVPLDGDMTKIFGYSPNNVGFIRFDNGTIFKVSASELNPIGSYGVYNALGGNTSNTAQLTIKALDTFQIGNPI